MCQVSRWGWEEANKDLTRRLQIEVYSVGPQRIIVQLSVLWDGGDRTKNLIYPLKNLGIQDR